MFQVSRRILPARGDLGSSMRIQILEGEGLHHLFTQHLFPSFKNENNSYGQKYKNNEFSRGCFFTQCFLQPHQQTTVTAEPFLVFSKLPQKRRHKISLTLQPNPPFQPEPCCHKRDQGHRLSPREKKKITKLLRTTLKF